nr:MAG TPA: hypothetical protein [Caudoviricetes sp.]
MYLKISKIFSDDLGVNTVSYLKYSIFYLNIN